MLFGGTFFVLRVAFHIVNILRQVRRPHPENAVNALLLRAEARLPPHNSPW